MKKSSLILWLICLWGSLFQLSFFSLNEVMKIADSFAYLQMSYFLEHLSGQWLGSGWFGFVYSLPIAIFNIFLNDGFFAGKIVNIILWNISALLIWKISRKILSENFSLLVVFLSFFSASFLSFHIHILSENIYIPLFLWLFLNIYSLVEEIGIFSSPSLQFARQKKQIFQIACIMGILYLTRAEAFIYIGSIGILAFGLLFLRKISFQRFFMLGSIFFLTFFLFISPYLWHLHSITWEWSLTNKWASNLRQAELRGVEKMDDAGFEQAVAELTADRKHLIAGFAGGMRYEKPQIEWSLREIFSKNPQLIFSRIWENQKKLFLKNIPEIFLGDAVKLSHSDDSRFGNNAMFFIWLMLPFFILGFGFWKLFRTEKIFLSMTLAFFLPACFFFTLFFTLNRYFIIFYPIFLIIFVYGISEIYRFKKVSFLFFVGNILSIYMLSCLVYWNSESPKDTLYQLKQEAGIWLSKQNLDQEQLDIMERFPIVTYYVGSKTRFITPYTQNPQDIRTYALFQGIEFLVVDTMDFLTYRPALASMLENTPEGFIKFKEFSNNQWEKVILYQIKK